MKTKKLKLFSFIWMFVKLQKWKFFFIFLLSLVWSLDATVWPYILRKIIDVFNQFDTDRSAAWPTLKWWLVWGAGLLVLIEAGFRTRDFVTTHAFPKTEADIRMAMFDHVQHHSPKYFNEHFAGSLSNKVSDMITQVSFMLDQLLRIFIPALASCILSIAFFYAVSPLFAIILAGWILLHLGICFAFTPKCAQLSNIHGEARSSLAGKIVDSFTNNFTVNLFFRFKYEKAQIAKYQNIEIEKNFLSRIYSTWLFLWLSVLFLSCGSILNGFMIMKWFQGGLTTGEIIQVFYTTWTVFMQLWFAGEMIPQFFQAIGIANQALTVMNDPQDLQDKPGAISLKVTQGEIVFDHVSFHYGERQLFQNKEVQIRSGEKVGLVGYSGAGKSTFVNLILRFFPVEKGRILIDGQNIADCTLESLRSQVALIPQDPVLFHRTLEENIRYGRVDATHEEIIAVAKLAHCDEFIRKTPQGYQSLVGERGTKLSGGERQRIAIARAMLTKAPILILDEATSALDSITESYIQDSLEKLMQNRTTIVIAHRLSTLAKMDRILVFDQGKIVEQGSHDSLLSQGGHYAKLWKMQAGGFLPNS